MQLRDYALAAAALRGELSAWLQQTRRLDPPGPHGGGEDEANYALTWFPYHLVWHDPAALDWFGELFQALAGWVARSCVNGYEPRAEAHHGPEPFLLFLPRYAALTGDPGALELLDAAAGNILGAHPDVPAWYDPARRRFRSWQLGTREVREDAVWSFESAEHLRFIHLALAIWKLHAHQPYLDWALEYGGAWAARISRAPAPMPLLWDAAGRGLGQGELRTREQRTMAAENHHVFGDPLAGIENLLASGAVNVFADLHDASGDEVHQAAARRIVVPLVGQLADPLADPAAAAVMTYRERFGDHSFDDAIRVQVQAFAPPTEDERLLVVRQRRERTEPGVGRRMDMLRWARLDGDGALRWDLEPCAAALALAWQVTGEVAHATRALRQAAERLRVARRVLRGGREHADMGGSVAAVAQGHGRNWGVGTVTGCLGPLLLGATEPCGAVQGRVAFDRGLPPGVGSLVAADHVVLGNFSEAPVEVAWRSGESGTRTTLLASNAVIREELRP